VDLLALGTALMGLGTLYFLLRSMGVEDPETLLFVILDVSAKVGFGLLLLRSRAIFGETTVPEPSAGEGAATPADD